MPRLRAAEGRVRRLAGVLGQAEQLHAAAAGGPAAAESMVAAEAWPAVLWHSGAVLAAMTSGFDPATPNTARVYSRLLGGKDHFAPDRAEADVLLEIYPLLAEMVQKNRAFLARAVTWAAGERIRQFIDLGAGLPVPPAIHETAREVANGTRVQPEPAPRHRSGHVLAGVGRVSDELRLTKG